MTDHSSLAAPGGPRLPLVARLDHRLYPGVTDRWDDQRFREHVLDRLQPRHHLLDLGAGAGIVPEMNFRGLAQRVCGVDPDPRVVQNPNLDEGRVGRGEELPFDDASFDLVTADNVLEHLDDPVRVFSEVARVLRPGGRFLAKTPNRWHYMPLLARFTPLAFHRYVNRIRGRACEDTFPTRYRANTPADLERSAARSGLRLMHVWRVECRPEYLRFNALTYMVGWAWERAVNLVPGLARFRVLLIAEMEKPS